jgi:diadenosine tetraphosphate (Ap4A) HIT family hydrolase
MNGRKDFFIIGGERLNKGGEYVNCPFCNMPTEQVLLENEHAKAFFDKYPVQKGHLLVVPKRHIEIYFEATEDEIIAIH